jgi:hypothetical protein
MTSGATIGWTGILSFLLLGCSRSEEAPKPEQKAAAVPTSQQADELSPIIAAARQKVRELPGSQCGADPDIPDSAFLPVEITGDQSPELVLSLDNIPCTAKAFSGTAGGILQFWSRQDGRMRLILEQQIERFTPGDRQLVTLEHSGHCQTPGADFCRVTYQWNARNGRMEPTERILASKLPAIPKMAFNYDLSRR